MTQEQKRIKLAEAGGLKVIDVPFIPRQTKAAGCVFTDAARTEWRKCYPNSCGVYGIPDYFNDLNAVHDLENVLNDEQARTYAYALYDLANGFQFDGDPWTPEIFEASMVTDMVRTTAANRAEAIGLALNLW
jgi:hypothetical protein